MRTFLEKFARNHENIQMLLNQMNDGLIITNNEKKIIAVNPKFYEITGYKYEEVINQNPRILQSGKTDRAVFEDMWNSLDKEGTWTGELVNRRKNGEDFWSYITITHIKRERPEETYFLGMMRDITERKKAEEKMTYLAYNDTVTQLPNRTYFVKALEERIIESSEKDKLAVLFLDLNRFKNINDSLGHNIGDQLLYQVAQRLTKVVGTKGIVSRFGGDEFTVLLHSFQDKQEAYSLLQQILRCFDLPFECAGHSLFITTSIGISFYPEHGTDIYMLMKNADNAMYQSKGKGRNNFQVFNKKMNEASMEVLIMEQELRQAIEENQFRVFYQLQVDVQTGAAYGVEALIRWEHPVKGMVSPAYFLPIAEESDLIVLMDDWVLQTACEQTKKWHELGFPLMISVNISQKQFECDNFEAKVINILKETGLDPHFLCIEITENIAVVNLEQALKKLNDLKNVGIHVSLDDFGTGYSSLSKLKKFPIDTLKIDQSFVRQTEEDQEENHAIVKLIIAMAKSLNFSVICEGVETEEQLTFIREEGCQHAQGYFFSKPLSALKCEAMMEQMRNAIQSSSEPAQGKPLI